MEDVQLEELEKKLGSHDLGQGNPSTSCSSVIIGWSWLWRVILETGCWVNYLSVKNAEGVLTSFRLAKPSLCGMLGSVPPPVAEPVPPAAEVQSPDPWTSREIPLPALVWAHDTRVWYSIWYTTARGKYVTGRKNSKPVVRALSLWSWITGCPGQSQLAETQVAWR